MTTGSLPWRSVSLLLLALACGRATAQEPGPAVRWRGGWLPQNERPQRVTLAGAAWVWSAQGNPASAAPTGTRYFRRKIHLPADRTVTNARIALTADNGFELFVNGRRAGRGSRFDTVFSFNLTGRLHPGANTLAVAAVNTSQAPNPAGLIGRLKIEFERGDPIAIPTDRRWRTSDEPSPGWEGTDFDDSAWPAAGELGPNGMAPWGEVKAEPAADVYAAFRGAFQLPRDGQVTIKIIAAHWFQARLDGEFLTEGPARFPLTHPEYEVLPRTLKAGRHVISALVHDEGVSTRMLRADLIPPFLLCEVSTDGQPTDVQWKCRRLPGYIASGVRISPQFAWIEWCDTRANPPHWEAVDFDDRGWQQPARTPARDWAMRPLAIGHVRQFVHRPKRIAQGRLTGPFEVAEIPDWPDEDDVSWYRRNLQPAGKADGVWRRYDLGRVRLGRPDFLLDVPAGAVVEFAYAESLVDRDIVDGYTGQTVVRVAPGKTARVLPYIPLSAGLSRNLDHYVAQGGVQRFGPITPKGGRFLEVHVRADPAQVRFLDEKYVERCYFGPPQGSFSCDDPLLEKIWMLGVETLRGCAEDAVIDNPTRERGQWTGDVASVNMPIAAAAYSDLRLFKRAIRQTAYSARADGLVPGLNPGGPSWMGTYAVQWVDSNLHYYQLTGDRDLLEEMYPYAVRCLAVFQRDLTETGLAGNIGWNFIDWGYVSPEGPSDMGSNLHYYSALEAMIRWSKLLGRDPSHYEALAKKVKAIIRKWLVPRVETARWDAIGYHSAVLSLIHDLVPAAYRPAARDYLKRQMQRCFPNDPHAPRLSGPRTESRRLITPYFSYYAFPPLIENGEMDFVLDQYRTCWGWGLEQGLTTQPEVFDLGWSHCHVWASSPTAQLSQYVLGLKPRYDLGKNHFLFRLIPGRLGRAAGRVPLLDGSGSVRVEWHRGPDGRIAYRLESPVEIWLHTPHGEEATRVEGRYEITLDAGRQGSRRD